MTWYTILKLLDRFWLSKTTELVCISQDASKIIGTSADLKPKNLLSVWDLLHGLMLPSGNDAAHALAEHFGKLLLGKSKSYSKCFPLKTTHKTYLSSSGSQICGSEIWKNKVQEMSPPLTLSRLDISTNSKDDDDFYDWKDKNESNSSQVSTVSESGMKEELTPKQPLSPLSKISMYEDNPPILRFLNEMNKNAKLLGMNDTYFDSPHGLANKNNKSTAYDMARLSLECVIGGVSSCKVDSSIRNDFRAITKCKIYQWNSRKQRPDITYTLSEAKTTKAEYKWKNTNKLLSKGYWGIKTGITNTAGPCLAAFMTNRKRSYLVILLNSRSMDARWVEVMKIIEYSQRDILNHLKLQRSLLKNARRIASIDSRSYPQNQFKQKKSNLGFKKWQTDAIKQNSCMLDNRTPTLKNSKNAKLAAANSSNEVDKEPSMLPSIDSKSE